MPPASLFQAMPFFAIQSVFRGTGSGRFPQLALVIAALAANAQAAPSLESVLTNMDSAASAWQGMRAQVESVRYMSLVDDRSVETGRLAVRRLKSGAVTMLLEFQMPSHYYLSVREAKVERYKPRINTVEEFDLSEYKDRLENALLLGFGTAGRYLDEHYEISLAGEETIGGHDSVKLDLLPKNPRGELNNKRIEMWISTSHWQPVQQKIYDQNPKDYRLSTYTEIEVNPSFSAREFRLPLARDTKRVRPQR